MQSYFFFTLAQFIIRPNFNIKGNRLNFLSTTMHKLRDLLQQTDLKHLNLSGRYKCSKKKGHFFVFWVTKYIAAMNIYIYILLRNLPEYLFLP